MAKYEIHGGKPLNGTVVISGAKNAAVAILPAALLVKGKCRIENVPNISDVRILMNILHRMGAKITSPERNVVEIDCSEVTCTEPDADLVKKMRASYYLMGALLRGRLSSCIWNLGFFPNDARKNCPLVLTAFTGWSSERCFHQPRTGFQSAR